jgi:4-hydroxy-tetrahydrodipicolinate reductase
MLKIAVLGAGRMGREIVSEIATSGDAKLAGLWVRAGRPAGTLPEGAIASSNLAEVLADAEVAMDFSLPSATLEVLDAVTRAQVPLVSGVTGLEEHDMRQLQVSARSIPLLYDRNMSLGIAVLQDLVARAAPRLAQFLAEIHETHHVHKKDAPSGTAIALGQALAGSMGRDFEEVYRYEPAGAAVRYTPEDIVFAVTRRGEVAGEHTVIFRSEAESLELTHRVSDRRVFAQGALRAAGWLVGQPPGFYRMSDMMGGSQERKRN